MAAIIAGITLSYFLGSFPTAYLAGRLLKGLDIRQAGSGNVGATNALRVLGKGPGIVVLLIDVLKGVVACVSFGSFAVTHSLTDLPAPLVYVFCGLASVIGHNWPVFLGFKGGKGIATTLGVLIGLSFQIHGLGLILTMVVLTWIVVLMVTRIVSISSVLAGLTLPVYLFLFKFSVIWICIGVLFAAFGVLRHMSNIKRFLEGKEKRIF